MTDGIRKEALDAQGSESFSGMMTDRPLGRFLDYALLLLALGAGGNAVWQLRQPAAELPGASWLWGLLIAAGIGGGVALRRMEAWLPDGQPPARPVGVSPATRRRIGFLMVVAAVGLTAWVVTRLWPDFRQWQGTQWPWLAALALILLGGRLIGALGEPAGDDARRRYRGNEEPPADRLPRWVEVTAFVLIGALAVFLRTYRLSEIPAGIYVDETNGALDSLYILEGRGDSPFGTGWYETPNGYIYYMALLFKLFGANHLSLKAASIIPAVLTVWAVYPLGRVLFGPTAAIAAMLFMAVSRWHLTMSRWGWNEVAPPVFQVLATFYLVRGLRDRRASDFVAGGLLTGLVTYTYLSSRLIIATLGFFALYWLLADPDGPLRSWKRHRDGFILFLLAAMIAVAPIAVTYITNPFTFLNRVSEISVFNEVREKGSYAPLIENIENHLKFFHYKGDRSGKHNLPGEPQTDPITGVLFVIGLGYGLLRLRDRRRGLLWLWMVFGLIGGIFSVLHESPQAYRTLHVVPAVTLLAGDVLARLARGVLRLGRASAPEARTRGRSAARAALAGVVLIIPLAAATAWEASVYFGRQANSPAVKGSFNPTESWVAKEVIEALERNTVVYLSPRFYDFSPLRFLVYGVVKAKTGKNTLDDRPYLLARPEVDLPVPETGTDALFLLDHYYWNVIDYFGQYYPDAAFDRPIDTENRPLCVRGRLSRSALAAVHGLRARFVRTDGTVEEAIVERIDEDWSGRDIRSAAWSGGLRVERSGLYEIAGEENLHVVVDDRPWNGERFLGRGLHKLSVERTEGARSEVARLLWKHWAGEPVFHQVTPFLLLFWAEGDPFYSPFSAHFRGKIRIEKPGRYFFDIQADDGARLILDGEVVAEELTPLRANRPQAEVDLEAGEHSIQIDYFQVGGSNALEFYWRGPGVPYGPVPPDVLIPAAPVAGNDSTDHVA
jgi:4-amino-4-deoxy-L-arabinose transferase-like glycosyltransferase